MTLLSCYNAPNGHRYCVERNRPISGDVTVCHGCCIVLSGEAKDALGLPTEAMFLVSSHAKRKVGDVLTYSPRLVAKPREVYLRKSSLEGIDGA